MSIPCGHWELKRPESQTEGAWWVNQGTWPLPHGRRCPRHRGPCKSSRDTAKHKDATVSQTPYAQSSSISSWVIGTIIRLYKPGSRNKLLSAQDKSGLQPACCCFNDSPSSQFQQEKWDLASTGMQFLELPPGSLANCIEKTKTQVTVTTAAVTFCQALTRCLKDVSSLITPYEEGTIIISVLQLRKPRLREVNQLACDHTACEWQNPIRNQFSLSSEPAILAPNSSNSQDKGVPDTNTLLWPSQSRRRTEGKEAWGGATESLVTLSELMLRPADCTPGSLPAKQELTEWQLCPCLHVFSFLFSTILLGRTTRLSRSLLKTENLFRQQL